MFNPEELFPKLIELKKRIGAPDVTWTMGKPNLPMDLDVQGIPDVLTGNPFKLIVVSSGQNMGKMEQRLLYIPQSGAKFHFMECSTIQNMRIVGRGERYVVTNRTTGEFKIYQGAYDAIETHLDVCKNCLYAWNYKGYRALAQQGYQDRAVRDFDIKEFFTHCQPLFSSLPLRTGETLLSGNDYARNWPNISKAYRACKGWHCEQCGVDLHDRTDLLHTHHVNGNRNDIHFSNLVALCVLCHSKIPRHRAPFVADADRLFIQQRRKDRWHGTKD